VAWLLTGLVLLALAAAGVTYARLRARPAPLAPNWTAIVHTLAGDGIRGAIDGATERARFSEPFGVAVSGDVIFVSDAGDAHRIRRLGADGVVTTVAGDGPGFADGPGRDARFRTPSGLAVDAAGGVIVADTGNHAIRRLSPEGTVTTLAGTGEPGNRDGPAGEAQFDGPIGVAVDAAGRILVADTYNDRIRAILPGGRVVTLAGAGPPGWRDGPAGGAAFDTPSDVAVDAAGSVYVADTGNDAVRVISTRGDVSTIVPSGPGASVSRPMGIDVSPAGVAYVTDWRGRVVEIHPETGARHLAGGAPGFADGPGEAARFREPAGLAWVADGQLVVADSANALVRVLAAPERTSVRPPVSPRVAPRFDAEHFAWLPLLWPLDPMAGPHEIAGTLGEARGEAGGGGPERFHAGIDIREAMGTPVRVVRDAVVSRPVATGSTGTLNEWFTLGPVTYVHVRVGRDHLGAPLDPRRFVITGSGRHENIRVRVRRGTTFRTGDVLGTVNRFAHVHLNVGWLGEEHNPLLLRLPHFRDSVAPTIPRGGIRLFDEAGGQFTRVDRKRTVVSGRVSITVEAYDQVDGNLARRRLGLFRLGYQVLDGGGRPVADFEQPRITQTFARLGADPEAPLLAYAGGSGIPFYGTRITRFIYQVTNEYRDGVAARGAWDTRALPPGDYTVRIVAADVAGNEALANRDLPVVVVRERPPGP
jgi:sugar lactone lactonase YvrE